MTVRKAITPTIKLKCLFARYDITCEICGSGISEYAPVQWDHTQALIHGGEDDYHNLRPVHTECHKEKTARDIAANAKVKRILADKPSRRPMKSGGRKMQSRPFQKRPDGKPATDN